MSKKYVFYRDLKPLNQGYIKDVFKELKSLIVEDNVAGFELLLSPLYIHISKKSLGNHIVYEDFYKSLKKHCSSFEWLEKEIVDILFKEMDTRFEESVDDVTWQEIANNLVVQNIPNKNNFIVEKKLEIMDVTTEDKHIYVEAQPVICVSFN